MTRYNEIIQLQLDRKHFTFARPLKRSISVLEPDVPAGVYRIWLAMKTRLHIWGGYL